jgi:4'-phosphopantetheinyl transferase
MEQPSTLYWLEQKVSDVPAHDLWLGGAELLRLSSLRFQKRRTDWRLGRWTAKCSLLRSGLVTVQSLTQMEILPSNSGAPEVFLHHKPAPVSISLSHRAGIAACAISSCGVALGCDLELIENRSDAFIADYFTIEEQDFVSKAPVQNQSTIAALVWSAKESALKHLRTGLRIDTKRLMVCLDEERLLQTNRDSNPLLSLLDRWHPLQVRYEHGHVLHGWWRVSGDFVNTLLSSPPCSRPGWTESGSLHCKQCS